MTSQWLTRRGAFAGAIAGTLATMGPPAHAADPPLRLGLLRFGTAAWELDVIVRHDLAPGLAIEAVGLATSQATQTALQARSVDMIVQDWLWVSRLRASGQDWTFAPFSAAAGALMAPSDTPIRGLADLAGKRLGIAGTPLDKSWLILRAFAQRQAGIDLAQAVEASFAAPPLLSEQLRQGRLDAVLTYWPEAARLRAAGMTRVLSVQQAIAGLGIDRPVPLTGYVFGSAWARDHNTLVSRFLAAGLKAQALLAQSDAEWDTLRPLTGAHNGAELTELRDAYRAGIPSPRTDPASVAETDVAMGRLYEVLAATGGPALVGEARQIAPGTFWSPAS